MFAFGARRTLTERGASQLVSVDLGTAVQFPEAG